MYQRSLKVILFLFVSLFTMLCWHSRLATDDYWYIWNVNKYGILQSVSNQYMEWCGRFVSEFCRDVLYYYLQLNQTYYFLFPLISFVLFILGVRKALGSIAGYLKFSIESSQKWLASISFVALVFFLSIDKGECWFWYNALNDYLLSIVAFVWGLFFLFQNRNTFLSYVGVFVCMFYVGGGSEVYSVIFGLMITVFIVYRYKQVGSFKSFVALPFNKKLIVFYIGLAISFLIVVIAPGNYLRATLLPKSQFFYSFFIVGKSIVKLTVLFLPLQIPYILVFSVLFILIGKKAKADYPDLFIINFKSFIIKATIYLVSILFIFFFIVAYLMVETGPARVWLLVSFLFSIYCCLLFFYAGYSSIFNERKIRVLGKTSIVFGFTFMAFNLINQYLMANKYSSAIDNRIAFLKDKNIFIRKDSLVRLASLPPNGMLYSAEITADTNHFTNKELRLGFNLNYYPVIENTIKNK